MSAMALPPRWPPSGIYGRFRSLCSVFLKVVRMDEDVYFHKTITCRAYGHTFRFRASQELFSSHDIDIGTRFLLRSIVENDLHRSKRILDIGCGYGPLGIIMKQLNPDSEVHLVDRDALAVSYARQNAALNDLTAPDIYGSLGYDDLRRADFDLIVSNIPGKAGELVITHLLREAIYYLAPGGTVAIVVVNPLEDTSAGILKNTPEVEILSRRQRSGHTVFHYRFTSAPTGNPAGDSLQRGVYHRDNMTMYSGNLEYVVQTAYGLPEFDTLNYKTELLMQALNSDDLPADTGRAAVFNPGQGHITVALWKMAQPQNILLIDRDLLALRYSQHNLLLNGCPPERISIHHGVGADFESDEKIDRFIGVLREEEGREAIYNLVTAAGGRLSPGGMLIITAGSTAITRLVTDLKAQSRLRITAREKRKGNSLLVLRSI